jgi:hypothetical protein
MCLIFIGKTPEKSSSADGLKAKQVQNVWIGWLSMVLEEISFNRRLAHR